MKAIAWYLGWAALAVLVGMMLDEQRVKAAPGNLVTIQETFHLSRECPNSKWEYERMDGETVTFSCTYDDGDEGLQ